MGKTYVIQKEYKLKDNNRPVNDIFQNDNGSKNKTKTILLLTIVAIILISVFLIIAWVMTRDNPIQAMQNQNTNEAIINEPKNPPLPYAHNMDNENPLGLDTTKETLGLNEKPVDNPMSNVPPVGVPINNANTTPTTEQQAVAKDDDFENNARFQAALRDLERQHTDKKEIKKEEEPAKTKEQTPTKVITPLAPKDTTIARAPDPTKSAQKPAPKPIDKEKAKPADSVKPNPQPVATQKPKEPEKPALMPIIDREKPDNKKVIQRPQNNVVSANQGKAPEKGHYIQVGSFVAQEKITPEFLNKIAKYNYRILKVEEKGGIRAKYLIGPYKTRAEVKQIETKIRTEINQGAFYVDHTK